MRDERFDEKVGAVKRAAALLALRGLKQPLGIETVDCLLGLFDRLSWSAYEL